MRPRALALPAALAAAALLAASLAALPGLAPVPDAPDAVAASAGAHARAGAPADHAFHTLTCPIPPASLDRPLERCNVRATPTVGPANEIDLAVDPRDPDHMVVVGKGYAYQRNLGRSFLGAVITPYATTFDGGLTWTEGYLQPLSQELAELPILGEVGTTATAESDPVVEFAADGSVLVQTLRVNGQRGLPMYRSDDGGRTFAEVGYAYEGGTDKNWMVTDPFTGHIYAVTLHDGGAGFVKSVDHGRTWSAPVKVCECRLPGIDVGEDGAIHVVGLGGGYLRYVRSDDGGATWTPTANLARHDGIGTNPCNGRLFRMAQIGVVAASKVDGGVYVVWAAKTPGAPQTGLPCPQLPLLDVFLAQSHDGGRTWSEPQRVNDDPTDLAAQFMPTVAVSPNGRDVHVAWFDQRADPAGLLAEVCYAHSPDAGASWDPNLLVSEQPILTTLSHHQSIAPVHTGVFVGDYIALHATDERAVVAFPDTRYGRADIFVATIV